jgi:hypothetical protein
VTSVVTGSGTYTVANVKAATGSDRFAGWSLVVVDRDAYRGAAAVARSGPGRRPTVRYAGGGLKVTGLPAGAAIVEVTLYRVTKLDRTTTYALRAKVSAEGATAATLIARPVAPR